MEPPLVAVILAGGRGTRLYPASRPERPKQFLRFDREASLLERTVTRAGFADERYVLAPPAYTDLVREHAPGAAIIEEPLQRDTGPALVYAAERIRQQVGDCVLLCLPSDHHISGAFEQTARQAASAGVETGGLVTIGIEPDRPATGYGYIEPAGDSGQADESRASRVARFVEKPDAETAQSYVDAGWYWNAGMFAWTPTALLDAAMDSPLAPVVEATREGTPERGFQQVDSVNIDTAILERAGNRFVVPASFEWDDMGTWNALGRVRPTDDRGNATVGNVYAADSENCVLATDGQLDAIGVENLVVASFDGRTVVLPRDESDRLRDIATRRENWGCQDATDDSDENHTHSGQK